MTNLISVSTHSAHTIHTFINSPVNWYGLFVNVKKCQLLFQVEGPAEFGFTTTIRITTSAT